MDTQTEKLKVAAIGDIHLKEFHESPFRQIFTDISKEADILAICGDLTNLGLPIEAKMLLEDLKACSLPVVAVLGNHDYHSDKTHEIIEVLADRVTFLGEDQTFEIKGVGFAGAKGFGGGFDNYMLGSFGEPIIKEFVGETLKESFQLENSLHSLHTKKTVVILHYSPIQETLMGEPAEIQPFLGSSRMAETIDRFDVNAVFHGHAHHGKFEGKTPKGIPVYNVCYDLLKEIRPDRPYAIIEV